MPKASKQTAPVTMENEVVEDRSCELEEFTVDFVSLRRDHDLAPMLAGLPGGLCQCPHWGVVTAGTLTATYPDRHEVFEAGDAFFMPPGHTAAARAGAEFIQFSPTDLLTETHAAIARAMQDSAP